MAKTETLNLEVKSNIKSVTKDTDKMADSLDDVNKEAKESIGNFTLMGVSLNGVKSAFGKVIPMAKAMFGSLKAGLISTGIGAFIVAIGSLVTWFTRTKKGAEVLETAFKTVGSAISVVLDRIGGLGEAITLFFQGKWAEAAAAAKAAISGIAAEIVEETAAMIALTQASQKLADAQRELNVETAQAVADIEKLKLAAEDITKSYVEREKAAVSAFAKETELENKRIKLAEEAVALEVERHKMLGPDGVMAADLDALAELEINLANIRQESAGRQISLQNFLNGLRETEKAEIQADKDAKQASDDAEWDAMIARNDKWNEEKQKQRDKDLAGEEELAANIEAVKEKMLANSIAFLTSNLEAQGNRIEAEYNKEIELAEANAKSTEDIEEKYEGKRAQLAEKQKKLKIGLATIDMFQSVIAAYNQGMGVPPPAGLVIGPASAALALAAGMANINSIMQTDVGGGGGGGVGGIGGVGAVATPPAPQMMSGSFDLTGGQAVEPTRAYVVSDDITSSQNGLEIIRRRATI